MRAPLLRRWLSLALACAWMSGAGCDYIPPETKTSRVESFTLRGDLEQPAGNVPVVWPLKVEGWALDDLTTATAVDIVLDDRIYHRITQRAASPELCARFPARTNCGHARFHGVVDEPRLAPGPHRIRLRIRNDRGGIRNVVDRTFVVADQPSSADR